MRLPMRGISLVGRVFSQERHGHDWKDVGDTKPPVWRSNTATKGSNAAHFAFWLITCQHRNVSAREAKFKGATFLGRKCSLLFAKKEGVQVRGSDQHGRGMP